MAENDTHLPSNAVQVPQEEVGHGKELPAERVTPNLCLYQPTFPLSEADFMRLQQSSPVLSAVGGVVIAFGISYVLPVLVRVWRAKSEEQNWQQDDFWLGGVIVIVGLTFLTLGTLFTLARKRLMKRIRTHFAENPGHHEVRGASK